MGREKNGHSTHSGEYLLVHGGIDAITGPIIQCIANGSSIFIEFGATMGQDSQNGTNRTPFSDGLAEKLVTGSVPNIEGALRTDIPNQPTNEELLERMDQSGLSSEADIRQTIKHMEWQAQHPVSHDGAAFTHYHIDHIGNAAYLNESIPLAMTSPTWQVARSIETLQQTTWEDERTRFKIRNGASGKLQVVEREHIPVEFYEPYQLGEFTLRHIPTSHSAINSSAIEVTYPSGTRILDTGDIRMGKHTLEDFIPYLENNPPPDVIFWDGTKVGSFIDGYTERDLLRIFTSSFKRELGTSYIMVPARQFERLYVIQMAANKNNRKVYLPLSLAGYLYDLQPYRDIEPGIPDIHNFIIYVDPRKSGTYKESDYPIGLRDLIFSNNGINKVDLDELKRAKEEKSVVVLSSEQQLERLLARRLIARNGNYVHSKSGAFDKETETVMGRIKRKVKRAGLTFNVYHASGHCSTEQLKELATHFQGRLVATHTEKPREASELMTAYAKPGSTAVSYVEKHLPYDPVTFKRVRD